MTQSTNRHRRSFLAALAAGWLAGLTAVFSAIPAVSLLTEWATDDRRPNVAIDDRLQVARVTMTPGQEPASGRHEQIARQIQRELRRLGCYSGPIDGRWSEATREASLRAVELSLAGPDPAVLILLQSQTHSLCEARPGQPASRQQDPRASPQVASDDPSPYPSNQEPEKPDRRWQPSAAPAPGRSSKPAPAAGKSSPFGDINRTAP